MLARRSPAAWLLVLVAFACVKEPAGTTADTSSAADTSSSSSSGSSGSSGVETGGPEQLTCTPPEGGIQPTSISREVIDLEGDGPCLSPCDTCVMVVGAGGRNACSQPCQTDEECSEAGQVCAGCFDFKACLRLCFTHDDCHVYGAEWGCEFGICTWAT